MFFTICTHHRHHQNSTSYSSRRANKQPNLITTVQVFFKHMHVMHTINKIKTKDELEIWNHFISHDLISFFFECVLPSLSGRNTYFVLSLVVLMQILLEIQRFEKKVWFLKFKGRHVYSKPHGLIIMKLVMLDFDFPVCEHIYLNKSYLPVEIYTRKHHVA